MDRVKGILASSPIHKLYAQGEMPTIDIVRTINPIQIKIKFLVDFLIQLKSFFMYASVIADQKGVIIIVNPIVISEKYLNAIL